MKIALIKLIKLIKEPKTWKKPDLKNCKPHCFTFNNLILIKSLTVYVIIYY